MQVLVTELLISWNTIYGVSYMLSIEPSFLVSNELAQIFGIVFSPKVGVTIVFECRVQVVSRHRYKTIYIYIYRLIIT